MGFLHLFWGLLFLIDIRFNGFDVLPDVIGYVLFFLGFLNLESKSRHFHLAKNMSLFMIVLSVASLVITWASPGSWLFNYLYQLVEVILNLYIVFHMCYGISELAGRKGFHAFQNKAIQRWRWYFSVVVAAFIVVLFAPLLPFLGIVLGALLLIAMVVIYILMMLLTREAEQVLHR